MNILTTKTMNISKYNKKNFLNSFKKMKFILFDFRGTAFEKMENLIILYDFPMYPTKLYLI